MAQQFGKINEFCVEGEDWSEYQDRLEQYYIANDIIVNDKKKAILLSSMGASCYSLLRKLCAPVKPATKTFEVLCTIMQEHQNPKPTIIVQRFKFNTRTRHGGESISTYLAELRLLSEDCNYGELEEMLRDRLVCGINNDSIQKRLLSEANLTYRRAVEIATAMETAAKDIRDLARPGDVHKLHSPHSHKSTNFTNKSSARPHTPRTAGGSMSCSRCGDSHSATTCRYKNAECHFCHKKGHLSAVCFAKKRQQSSQPSHRKFPQQDNKVHSMESTETAEEEQALPIYTLYNIEQISHTALVITPLVEGKSLKMEFDTGSSASLLPLSTYKQLFSHIPLNETTLVLHTYTGEKVVPTGEINVSVTIDDTREVLPLVVVDTPGPPLFGRRWLRKFSIDISNLEEVHRVSHSQGSLPEILETYSDIFKDELGTLKGTTASIHVDQSVPPKFYRARTLPYVLKEKVEAELERLERSGVIEPVKFSDWATPIVPVTKSSGDIRLCGDYKLTANLASNLEQYPIPLIEDLFASLSGGKTFTKLDMSHAYEQLTLDEESKKLTTINTHKGLFRYNRLCYGISSAPAIFQRTMENLLQGLHHVCVYLDDIIITGSTNEEHIDNLREVLHRLAEAGLRLKRKKCFFMEKTVTYLGHKVTADGLFPTAEKIRAIQEAPRPTVLKELQSFLGLINYYGRFGSGPMFRGADVPGGRCWHYIKVYY